MEAKSGEIDVLSEIMDNDGGMSSMLNEENRSGSDSEFNDGYESDLMGDDDDRETLGKMSEKERETELFKRAERRDTLKHQWEIKKKIKQAKKQEAAARANEGDPKVRGGKRLQGGDDKRTNAMAQLKAQREVKQQQKKESFPELESDLNNNNEEEALPQKEPTRYYEPSEVIFQPLRIATLEEVNKLQITRDILERIIHAPSFEKAVMGSFVRVNIGHPGHSNPYRVAEIAAVVESSKEYTLGGSSTRKAFFLKIGNSTEVVRLEFVSNNPFSMSEFLKWKENCESNGILLPTVGRVSEMIANVEEALKYSRLKRGSAAPAPPVQVVEYEKPRMNFAMRKRELMNAHDVAMAECDMERANAIAAEMAELEQRADEIDKKRTATIQNIAFINERNRRRNLLGSEIAIKEEMRELKASQGSGQFDPFTRRLTKPSIPFRTTADFKNEPLITLPMPIPKRRLSVFPKHDIDLDIDIDFSEMPMPEPPRVTAEPPKKLPYGWRKWEEYKKKRGML